MKMSICTIFIKNVDHDKNKPIGTIQKHYNMKNITYELYKGEILFILFGYGKLNMNDGVVQ